MSRLVSSGTFTVPRLMTALSRLIALHNVRANFNQLGLNRSSKTKEEPETNDNLSPPKGKTPKKKKVSSSFIKLIAECCSSHSSTKQYSTGAIKEFWVHWNKTLDLTSGSISIKTEDGETKKRQNDDNSAGKFIFII